MRDKIRRMKGRKGEVETINQGNEGGRMAIEKKTRMGCSGLD
jgi:hypothetical protein